MDRLAELRRQRLLICEHLAWLEREIGQIEGASARPVGPSQAQTDAAVPSSRSMESPGGLSPPTRNEAAPHAAGIAAGPPTGVPADPENILEEFRTPPGAVKRDVRQGCLLYFAGALVLLGIGVAILYFTIGSR